MGTGPKNANPYDTLYICIAIGRTWLLSEDPHHMMLAINHHHNRHNQAAVSATIYILRQTRPEREQTYLTFERAH